MNRKIVYLISIFYLLPLMSYAQFSEEFGDGYIRVVGTGEIADSVHVWGDVSTAGRYLVPEGTTLPELISYSHGYSQLRSRESDIDWAKTQIEVKVSRYLKDKRLVKVAMFRYKYNKPEPVEMFEFDLQNNDIVAVEVRRKPSFADYVGVIAPVVGVIATSVLLVQNLR